MKQFLSFFFIGLFTLFISSSAALAQQTGSLNGQVVDTLGAVVVGASVTAIDAAGKEKTVVTSRLGEYSITGLAPGKYTIRTAAPTFQSYENTEVVIEAGRNELVIALVAAAIEETVEVGNEGQVTTDPDANASATVLKDKDLDALPDDPDELEAALQALAGPSSGPNGGQFYIDGFTGGRIPPKESIREIRINQNPFSAEYERLGFGRIEILTKPGSDKWRGSAFFNFNDESLNSRNPFALNRASSQMRFFGGNVSGPIQKGKSSFFLDVSNRDVRNAALVNATVLDPASFGIVPFQQEFTVPTSRLSISPRFDYQINTNNTLVARYSFTRNSSENQGISGFSLPSRAFETSNTSHEFRLTETMIVNPKTINETRFQYEWQKREQLGDNTIPTINVSGAFTGGGAQIGQNFTSDRRWELSNYTTTSLGKNNEHAVKFGIRLRGISVEDRSESGFGGTYVFNGFRATGDPCDINGDSFVSSIEQYRCRVLGRTEARYNPSQFVITTGDPLADISQMDVGLFVTDDWRVRPDLTLSFGLRYENQNNISDKMNLAPRFSFAWSPGAGGARQPKTVFRGGFGIFYDRFSENYSLQAERFNGTRQLQFIVPQGSEILSQPVFTANGQVQNSITAAQLSAIAPRVGTIRRVSDDLQAPYTMQMALGVERQLPMRTTLGAFFIASRNLHVLRLRNVNAPVCGLTTACPEGAALQALRPDPSLGNIYQYESSGFLNARQLIVNFNSRLNPNFTLFGNYRLGWAKGDAEGGGFFGGGGVGFPAYSYDLSNEYGRSVLGVRHNVFIGGNFTLPW
ncbi:MAG: TonB-dependent receptor, partial [Acidobacteriota bacterium]|nr:TonB-dependent receptor [Acidobacteriota bacterium]